MALCVTCDEQNRVLTGHYRLCFNGVAPIRFDVDLMSILGKDPIPEALLTIVKFPKELMMKENGFFSAWHSLNEDLLCGELNLISTGISEKPQGQLYEEAKEIMIKPEFQVSYRFEIGVHEDFRLELKLRFLPEYKATLEGHSMLNGKDVATISGGEIFLEKQIFPAEVADLANRFPVAPMIFAEHEVSEEQYRAMLDEGFMEILYDIQSHGELRQKKAKTYIEKPATGAKINSQRFKPPSKDRKAKGGKKVVQKKTGAGFDEATGTGKLVKFGTEKSLLEFIFNPNITMTELKFLNYHLTCGTWDSYFTHMRTFLKYCDLAGASTALPATVDTLVGFLCYLRNVKDFAYESVGTYLSGVKKLHEINHASLANFDHPRVGMCLRGIKHECLVLKEAKQHRCVVTWNVMIILGHLLGSSDMTYWDQNMLWTLMLFAYFGARRMGELISVSKWKFDPEMGINYSKIRKIGDDHIYVVIKYPKVSVDPNGITLDLTTWKDNPSYCPVQNYYALVRRRLAMGPAEEDEPVFKLSSGELVTHEFMNDLLEKLLRPYFPETLGKWSCHSFRAGVVSYMAGNPDTFNLWEAKIWGGWDSDTVDRYTRLNGQSRIQTQEKFQDFLRYKYINLT